MASPSDPVPPAVRAFDETAPRFDERFGEWRSVAAQRDAVRRYLLGAFPPGARLLELGGGTGEDALFMLERGFRVALTDGSPRMVAGARAKLAQAGYPEASVEQVVLERLDGFVARARSLGLVPFDGVYSNFAALNCVADLGALARPLARLLRPGGRCALVIFGRASPGEVLVELLRGRPRAALRRFRRGSSRARIGRERFEVWYPSARDVERALGPWFTPRARRGIGILVPPSAAEPFVSRGGRRPAAQRAAGRPGRPRAARLRAHGRARGLTQARARAQLPAVAQIRLRLTCRLISPM
jgi:SAM-dependent methyltransferase